MFSHLKYIFITHWQHKEKCAKSSHSPSSTHNTVPCVYYIYKYIYVKSKTYHHRIMYNILYTEDMMCKGFSLGEFSCFFFYTQKYVTVLLKFCLCWKYGCCQEKQYYVMVAMHVR